MKLAADSWCYRDSLEARRLDLVTLLAELAGTGAGINCLEAAGAHFPNLNDAFIDELLLRQCSVGVELVCLSLCNDFAWPDADERERQVADVTSWMDVAEKLKVKLLHVRTGKPRPDVRRTVSQEWVRQCLRRVLSEAEARGCTLAADDGSALFGDPAELIRGLDSPALKLSIDAERLGLRASELEHVAHVRLSFDKQDGPSDDVVRAVGRLVSDDRDGIITLEYSGKGNPGEALSGMRRRIEAAG